MSKNCVSKEILLHIVMYSHMCDIQRIQYCKPKSNRRFSNPAVLWGKNVPAAKPITKIDQKKVIPESPDTTTHTTYPNRQPKVRVATCLHS